MTAATDGRTGVETMRAIVQRTYGSADVLQPDRIERPTIAEDEVLVEVRAAGVDRGTWHLMLGKPYVARLAVGLRAPRNPVPGRDLAGVVVACGKDVTRLRVGDEVYGTGAGSFAEFVAAKERRLAPKPSTLTFEEAAAVPVSAQTALQGLLDVGRLVPGQRVLITGASGGVGSFAVQIAVAAGASVTAVCSGAKVDFVRALGAERVLDYATEDFAATGDRFDLVLDIGGSASLRRLRRVLTRSGTLVIVGGEGGGQFLGIGRQLRAVALSPFVPQRLRMFVATEHHEALERLTERIEAGTVRPAVDRVLPLDHAADAIRALDAGELRGKVVLVP